MEISLLCGLLLKGMKKEKISQEFLNYINIAVVWPGKYIDKFAETVVLNRGGKMYVAGDLKTAEEWLLNSQI